MVDFSRLSDLRLDENLAKPPDFGDMQNRQQAADAYAMRLSAPEQYTPYGSLTYDWNDNETKIRGINFEMSPEIQSLWDDATGYVGTAYDALNNFSADKDQYVQDIYQNFQDLYAPTREMERQLYEARAAERGLPLGDPMFANFMDPMYRAFASQDADAANRAIQMGLDEYQADWLRAQQGALNAMNLFNALPVVGPNNFYDTLNIPGSLPTAQWEYANADREYARDLAQNQSAMNIAQARIQEQQRQEAQSAGLMNSLTSGVINLGTSLLGNPGFGFGLSGGAGALGGLGDALSIFG
jgi:hypothetical protein